MAATKTQARTTAEEQMTARAKARRPQTIDDLSPDEELSPEEEAALNAPENKTGAQKLAEIANPRSAVVTGAPEWAIIPPDLVIPKGVEVAFMRIPIVRDRMGEGDNAVTPEMQIIIWELGVRDERFARARASMPGGERIVEEMAKQMIRCIDGKVVSWGNPLMVESAWEKMGAKYRNLLGAWYMKAHQLDDEERLDFFANRVVAQRAV